ncbi:hypothetical protein L226DRAFT_504141 [Lentinus tigrinus ALCF2SS1-7]|uniref:GST N-terminal domain-containing protein n=1 Tax=Lentinus tigrinus ALCF2SS1-6 TaxID=1328759 RepID=A0A5C2SFE4_9APHY|nr:hypothetical protein L227DRAFT_651995 [Lentinus tigrinus ALCF2SS1-6]RPD77731.1 hypothetical protein L226DRAFT_504141 [Lentinus tigrinus ALCF2SS1-7]
MPEPIVLYDIPGVTAKVKAWSPNTWKTRYCLNIKGIPYKTVWVEYPDIEALCKKIGASATDKRTDGTPLYTLPVIYDPNTKTAVSESATIARYLDRTYPDTPRLIPAEADALVSAFIDAFWAALDWQFEPIILPVETSILRPASRPYFRETREKKLGCKLEEAAPPGSAKHAQCWEGVQKGVHKMAGWLDADGQEKRFFMGDKMGITYADIMLASFFMWFKMSFGDESQEWRRIMSWDGGRWAGFMSAFERYEAVVEGEEVVLRP